MTTTNNTNDSQNHVAFRMEKSRHLLDWMGGELAHRAQPDAPTQTQVARVCELVNLAVTQLDFHSDLGMAWILLEQARQQLGHAAITAARRATGPDPDAHDQSGSDAEAPLTWFLQRDLMPWPEDIAVVVRLVGESGQGFPDPRPYTPLGLPALQMLSHSTMTSAAGDVVDPGDTVMTMAFGEYVSIIMVEAMELLDHCADQHGWAGLTAVINTGFEVSHLLAGAFPAAWQVFSGPAGFPDGSG